MRNTTRAVMDAAKQKGSRNLDDLDSFFANKNDIEILDIISKTYGNPDNDSVDLFETMEQIGDDIVELIDEHGRDYSLDNL
jgi:hypothetical protein